ncbi:GntR family transcriptional regulator [Agrobacterium tumefaciens]|uniref:GntR family transcriptional regulator n=1 Tax=Agrobacterium tumefaciens TaxID=358 RepID=UPI0021FA7904|nr:GntR family transcriptional regulator [Agrobacterium tumefaciens]
MTRKNEEGLDSAIGQSNLVAEVEERLYRAIASGELAPGTRIVEAELARRLEISRAPIREAARRLENRGLVTWIPRRGFFVRQLTANDAVDIYGVRIALESYAVRLTAANASREDIEGLRKLLLDIRSAKSEVDSERLVEADVVFHRAICALAKNPRLVAAFDSLASELRLALSFVNRRFETGDRFAERHSRLIDVILDGDPEKAAQALVSHLEHSRAALQNEILEDARRTD